MKGSASARPMKNQSSDYPALGLKISMYIAFAGGVITPIIETVRRWHQMADLHYFINWFDDYLIGVFLFFGAWKVSRSVTNGKPFLIASWGFATGMSFGSFIFQIQNINSPDPAPVSSATVVFVKGIMLITCILSLILTLNHNSTPKDIPAMQKEK